MDDARKQLEDMANVFAKLKADAGALVADAQKSNRSDVMDHAVKAYSHLTQAWESYRAAFGAMGIRPI